MKSPVSHVKVIVLAERVIAIGGFPPSASTVSRRCQMVGGCGVRIVMRWTAGSMPGEPTRTYVRYERRVRRALYDQLDTRALDRRRRRLADRAPGDRKPRGGLL